MSNWTTLACECKVEIECNLCCDALKFDWGFCISPESHAQKSRSYWRIINRDYMCPVHRLIRSSPLISASCVVALWENEKDMWASTFISTALAQISKDLLKIEWKYANKQSYAAAITHWNTEAKEAKDET